MVPLCGTSGGSWVGAFDAQYGREGLWQVEVVWRPLLKASSKEVTCAIYWKGEMTSLLFKKRKGLGLEMCSSVVECSPNMHEVRGSIPRTTATNASLPGWKFLLETPVSPPFTRTALFCGLDPGRAEKKGWPPSGSSQAEVSRVLKGGVQR